MCSAPPYGVPARLGFAVQEAVKEPEDHAAAICEIMAVTMGGNGLCFGADGFSDGQQPSAGFTIRVKRSAAGWKDLFAVGMDNTG